MKPESTVFRPVVTVFTPNNTNIQKATIQNEKSTNKPEPSIAVERIAVTQKPIQETAYTTIPSTWSPSDPRFQGVTVRKFIGHEEIPFSLFNPCMTCKRSIKCSSNQTHKSNRSDRNCCNHVLPSFFYHVVLFVFFIFLIFWIIGKVDIVLSCMARRKKSHRSSKQSKTIRTQNGLHL